MRKIKQVWERYLNFWSGLSRQKRSLFYIFHYTLLLLIAFLLAYGPFLLAGKGFMGYDGREQHYPALVYIGRYLRQVGLHLLHGEVSIPLFDLNLAMGGDIIATLNYYGFGNPLYLLSVFVPTHYMECFYDVLVVVRLYLAGLSFFALCAYHKKPFSHTLIGTFVYIFSGYAITSVVQHPFFAEPMIQLPLLLIGIDLIIQKKKPFIFIFTVFYSALCGFYFLYMMTIMLGVYTLIRFFDCYPENQIKNFFIVAGRIICSYLLGIGLSAPIFFPAIVGFLTSGRAGESIERNLFSYGWDHYIYHFLKLIAPPGSWDVLSLAAIVLPALATLFLLSKKQRRSLKLLVVISIAFYVLPLGGYIMNGFAYPSQRWTFGFALLLSYIVVEMLPDLLSLNRKNQLSCFTIFLLYAAAIFCDGHNRSAYNVVGVAMLASTLLILYLFGTQNSAKESSKKIGAIACSLLILFNVSINAIYRFSKIHANYIGQFTAYGTETERLETAIEREAEPYLNFEDGRFDSSIFLRNAGAVWRVPTPYGYWSIIGAPATDFQINMENLAPLGLHDFFGIDKRTNLEALFSTKYIIEKMDQVQHIPYGYHLIENTKKGNLIYENDYALPWGYTYDNYTTSEEIKTMNGVEIEEAMLQNIILEKDVDNISKGTSESHILNVPYEITDLKNIEWNKGILSVKKDMAVMTLGFDMPTNTEGYIRLCGFDINNSGQTNFNVTVQCENIAKNMTPRSTATNWYWGRVNYLSNLGYSEKSRTTCTITFPKKGDFKLDDIQLLALPMDKYPEQIEALRTEPLENITWETNKVSGTVDLSKNKILCMSIPYSIGWTAKVDGQKVEILKGNYMFMALPLTEGHHNIEFTYCSPGLKVGIVASVLSTGIVIYLVCQKRKKRQA